MSETTKIDDRRARKSLFDPTINLGNALVLASILAGGAIAWGQMNAKIDSSMQLAQEDRAIIMELQVSNAKLATLAELVERRLTHLEERMESPLDPKK